MSILEVVVLALGLSMDAFAVSISNTLCYKGFTTRNMLASSAGFGVFQGVMPIIGFFAGRLLADVISAVDHWVALVLLGFIGGKMLAEGIRALRRPENGEVGGVYTAKTLLLQSLATSVDALAVGVSLAALSVNIWSSAGLIAAITFTVCLFGAFLGRRFSGLLGDWAQVLGGLILLGIGIKIFVEHMFFAG